MEHLEQCYLCKKSYVFENDETVTLMDKSIVCIYCLDSAYEDPEEEEEEFEF